MTRTTQILFKLLMMLAIAGITLNSKGCLVMVIGIQWNGMM